MKTTDNKKTQIEFRHGWLSDTYEKQANAQGYTLGEKAEYFEKVRQAYLLLCDGYLTDKECDNVAYRIHKQLVSSVKKIEGSENERN